MRIVVRSSSQSCKDFVVDCDSSWSIIQLKEYIKDNHLLKPAVEHQKLIYRGKYVINDETVKDVFDENSPSTIVHLVLSPSSELLKKKVDTVRASHGSTTNDDDSVTSTSTTTPAASTSDASDGSTLRNRNAPSSGQQSYQYANYWTPERVREYYQQYSTAYQYQQYSSNNSSSSSYTTEQYNMMWRQYHQHYANYMQYYGSQHPAFQTGGVTTATTAADPGVPPAAADNVQPPPIPDNAVPQQPANPAPANPNFNPAMNAQGGAFIEDDGAQRDWLDLAFTMLRGGFFLSIIYFYSTLQRFVFVMSCVILVYLYQTGMFRGRRRDLPAPPAEENNAVGRRRPSADANNNNNNDDDDGDENNNGVNSEEVPPRAAAAEGDNVDGEEDDDDDDEEVLPPPPSLFATACTFVSTFFTSLLPQAPPAVN